MSKLNSEFYPNIFLLIFFTSGETPPLAQAWSLGVILEKSTFSHSTFYLAASPVDYSFKISLESTSSSSLTPSARWPKPPHPTGPLSSLLNKSLLPPHPHPTPTTRPPHTTQREAFKQSQNIPFPCLSLQHPIPSHKMQ